MSQVTCRECSFREWDGVDYVCTAELSQPGRPYVASAADFKPDWCPLENPKRVTREEVEQAIHPTVAVALQNMYRNNGDAIPANLHQFPVPEARQTPKGDR